MAGIYHWQIMRRELTEEIQKIPENLDYYIDYERMGRDMEMNGDILILETGFEEVHVFWNFKLPINR